MRCTHLIIKIIQLTSYLNINVSISLHGRIDMTNSS